MYDRQCSSKTRFIAWLKQTSMPFWQSTNRSWQPEMYQSMLDNINRAATGKLTCEAENLSTRLGYVSALPIIVAPHVYETNSRATYQLFCSKAGRDFITRLMQQHGIHIDLDSRYWTINIYGGRENRDVKPFWLTSSSLKRPGRGG
jgi:hypothetical protein